MNDQPIENPIIRWASKSDMRVLVLTLVIWLGFSVLALWMCVMFALLALPESWIGWVVSVVREIA